MSISVKTKHTESPKLRITVLGAAGNVGSRVVNEALARGHEVTAVIRDSSQASSLPPNVKMRLADVSKVDDVVEVSSGQDIVISAIRPAPGKEDAAALTTRSLMDGLARTGVRVLVVGGAATLTVPGKGGMTVLEDADFLPVEARHIGQASADQFDVCLAETRVNWTYLSPPAQLEAGERTANYRLGGNELIIDENGISKISMEDLSLILVDEAEHPRHQRSRFTAAY